MTQAPGPGPVPRAGEPVDVADASVGELMSNVMKDLSTLVRQEVELAKAEVKAEAGKAAKGAGMLGGAGFAGYLVVLFLSIALWQGLANVMDSGWAALIVAVVWAIAGAVLYATGRREVRRANPKPERTVETLQQVPDALKGERP
ncbi:phage holin family protein [Amycolatopsis sp. NPDC003861]